MKVKEINRNINAFILDFNVYSDSVEFVNSKKSKDTILFAIKLNLIGRQFKYAVSEKLPNLFFLFGNC